MFIKHILSRMFLFEADAGGGGGGQSDEDKAKAAKEKADAEAKQKQDELNKQFADRAAQAASAERKKILESLGVKDIDEALALTKAAKDADEKNKTEAEKLVAKAQEADAARIKAEAESKEKLDAANKRLMDSEIKINASAPVMEKDKVVRPAFRKEALDDVLLLVNRELITEENGTYKGVEKALSELAKAKPYLLQEKVDPRRGTPRDGGSGNRNRDDGERTPIISSL